MKPIIGGLKATYVVDERCFDHCFWKLEGTVCTHVNSLQLPYTVITVQYGWRGGLPDIGKCGKFGKLQISIKVAGIIGSHSGFVIYGNLLELLKMARNQNIKIDVFGIYCRYHYLKLIH